MKLKSLLLLLLITILLFSGCAHKSDNITSDSTSDIIQVTDNTESVEVTQETQTTVPVIEQKLSFIGVGDNIIYGTKEAKIHAQGTDRLYDYKPYYSGVSDIIANADISFINQETLMCGDGYSLSYYPMFNSPRQVGYDITDLGFDIINISNNHMLDKGAEGLEKTIEFWKSMDVLMIGGYENNEDYNTIRYYEKDGLKIAFLSYCEMTNGLSKSPSSDVVIPYLNEEDIRNHTAIAKENADIIFVSVHWGDEGSFSPNENQKYYAKLFADCGVDVILGHHPHVIQPVEYIEGKDGNKTLCVYSLGNFMAQQDRDYNMVGGIISFDIIYSENEKPRLENVIYNPTIFHFNGSFTSNNVYLFENYSPELALSHGVRNYYGNRFDYNTLLGYVKDTIDDEFLPDFFKGETYAEG